MFKVPEGGKVGVIGSGKGTTEFAKKRRHEFGGVDGSGTGED